MTQTIVLLRNFHCTGWVPRHVLLCNPSQKSLVVLCRAVVSDVCLQDMRKCDYSSFLTYSGPEAIRTELVDAANHNKLCDLLPKCVREAAQADMR